MSESLDLPSLVLVTLVVLERSGEGGRVERGERKVEVTGSRIRFQKRGRKGRQIITGAE